MFKIFSYEAFISASVGFSFFLVKLISSALFIGTRCICAWGTSMPTTAKPHLLQSNDFSIALAIGLRIKIFLQDNHQAYQKTCQSQFSELRAYVLLPKDLYQEKQKIFHLRQFYNKVFLRQLFLKKCVM